ncbi:unnamed protein product [Soboliphyme baturini]|uniref:OB domain-containing protein n=1 Tax=Soboliphyme baturini TaxID=241478 RepID=A0A183IV70_9BILA|nr:unnamed protein product [Soboliphyme baturini]
MIHQMLPSQGTLRIGSYEVPHVSVVGIVRSVTRDPLHVDYMIDDMTGPPIAVRKYINVESPSSNVVAMENTYVKVCGSIKNFEGKKSIAALGIITVTDLNDLTAHLMEVVQCKLFYTKVINDFFTKILCPTPFANNLVFRIPMHLSCFP